MPTKDELLAFAADHGIDVMSSATKGEIADAISEAGYEPETLETEGADVAEDTPQTSADLTPEEAFQLSRQAHFSTYRRVDEQREGEINPPPGPTTLQELGKPTEGAVTRFGE